MRQAFNSIPELDMVQRMPRLGKIGLGIKTKNANGREYPKEVDFFVLDPPAENAGGLEKAMYEKFRKVYGEKPKFLDVMLPCEDRKVFFRQAYKMYTKSGLGCTGNGIEASRLGKFFPKDSDEAQEPGDWFPFAPCTCDFYERGECKRMGNLQVVLPLVSMGGVWQIDTSSFFSICNINSEVAMYENMFGGAIAWLGRVVAGKDGKPTTETAFMLTREAQDIQHGEKTQTHWTMHLRMRRLSEMTFEQVQALRQDARARQPVALPEPGPETELIPGNASTPTTVGADPPLNKGGTAGLAEKLKKGKEPKAEAKTEAVEQTVEEINQETGEVTQIPVAATKSREPGEEGDEPVDLF